MTETNELQPAPELEATAAETQEVPVPAAETPAAETATEDSQSFQAPTEESADQQTEEAPTEEAPAEEASVEETPAEEAPAEETPAEEAQAEEFPVASDTAPSTSLYETKAQVVERLRAIEAARTGGDKGELDLLKQVFYKLHRADQLANRAAFIEAGGKPEDWKADVDPDEENFKAALAAIRAHRAAIAEEAERKKTENLQRKQAIIDRIKEMAVSPEDANAHFDEFKRLQAEWREIGAVPPEKATEIWKNYQLYVEQFYDLLKLNSEAREYDFKKNLTAKEQLIAKAEALAEETDIVAAFNKLQRLHAEYKEIGPVAKELRDQVWERFKAASTIINKRHQEHFETLKANEEANLQKKAGLCERIEAIQLDNISSFQQWDELTKLVLEAQAEWKTIGFANHKQNAIVFDRFRAACDRFFTTKAEYYRAVKDEQSANLETKRKLVEEAEALQDSTEWRKTTDRLIELQKTWKTVGAVPRKYSEQLWKRFTAACDKFFEAKNAQHSEQRNAERENLAAKQGIIENLKALAADKANATMEQVKELQAQWNEIGHVPFREKDRLYASYRAAADELYKHFGANQTRRRIENFQKSLKQAVAKGESSLARERERLQRMYETHKAEIQTYENNLSFLNAKSKSGNTLVAEMNRKLEKAREELALLSEKIKTITTEMRAEANAEAKAASQEPQA